MREKCGMWCGVTNERPLFRYAHARAQGLFRWDHHEFGMQTDAQHANYC